MCHLQGKYDQLATDGRLSHHDRVGRKALRIRVQIFEMELEACFLCEVVALHRALNRHSFQEKSAELLGFFFQKSRICPQFCVRFEV